MGETRMQDSAGLPGNFISQQTKHSTANYWNSASELGRSFAFSRVKQTEDRAFSPMEVGYSYIRIL